MVDRIDPQIFRRAADILRKGGLVAFPTETVYGLGGDARCRDAVSKIFKAKGRPATNPLIVHVAEIALARDCASAWPESAQRLAERFWPGPLTLVLPSSGLVDAMARAGGSTVALRSPAHETAHGILREFGAPVAAPSANRSTHLSPTTAQHVRDELGDAVDLIVDGGPCAVGIESTVLDLTVFPPRILRPGAVARGAIAQILRGEVADAATPATDRMGAAAVAGATGFERAEGVDRPADGAEGARAEGAPADGGPAAAKSPGQMDVHYAPRAPAWRFEAGQRGAALARAADNGRVAAVFIGVVDLPPDAARLANRVAFLPADAGGCARALYATLRRIDEMHPGEIDAILIEMPPAGAGAEEWAAVRDRLMRATRP